MGQLNDPSTTQVWPSMPQAGGFVTYTPVPRPDYINHPPHYKSKSGIECIQVTEYMNFCLGNAVKYIWRAGSKGDARVDLRKAIWYLNREIERLDGDEREA